MNDQKYFTVKDAAFYMNVHVQTLYSWINEGKIIAEKHPITKRVRISKEVIEAFIQSWKVWDNDTV